MARAVIGLVLVATPVSRPSASFHRVIRVHTRVGDVDRGDRRDKGVALVARATCVVMALGSPDVGAILHGAEVG